MSVSDLSDVLKPVDQARGLPNEHYVDAAVFEAEKRDVLFANWASIGFAHDVPNPGDVKPLEFAGLPIFLVRTKTGQIKVYENVCRHRGMELVSEAKNIGNGVIRCFYHSWCYAQTGELVTTPHVGGPGQNRHDNVKRDELGLLEVRSFVWFGVIFVNVSGDAPAFEDYAADALQRWSEFKDQKFLGSTKNMLQFDVTSNWKLPVENYCESYHLPWVHPGLNSYSRLEDHYHIENPGKFSGQGSSVFVQFKDDDGRAFPDFPDLSEQWLTSGEYIALYPNTLLGVQRDHCFAIVLMPHGPTRTVENIALFYANEDAAFGEEYQEMRQEMAARWHEVFDEDVWAVEGMQRGRRTIKYDGGKFSPAMDGPTHCFHHWVASQLEAGKIAAE